LNISSDDSAYGYGGNDSFEIVSEAFALVDGGEGNNDRLILEGIDLDFVGDDTLTDRISGIEEINLQEDSEVNELSVDLSSIQALTSDDYNSLEEENSGVTSQEETSDLLRISGSDNDTVSATGFSDSDVDVTVNGVDYDLYRHDVQTDAAFLLEQGVTFA